MRARKHDANPASTISTEEALRGKEVRAYLYVIKWVHAWAHACVCARQQNSNCTCFQGWRAARATAHLQGPPLPGKPSLMEP